MQYRITGRVIDGERLGRTLGTPTANLPLAETLPVANGVYAVTVQLPEGLFRGMANLGHKPTLGATYARGLEVHLFDFAGDLYNRTIAVDLLQFIRPEQRFASIPALQHQIEQDRATILRYFQERDLQNTLATTQNTNNKK
ncbi:MAG: riboflavin kinase [Alistipes sp.]|nr:riboflavin kinase [Alistipes sp.]